MIVTITKGRSLGGLGMYLLHDKREGEEGPHPETDERVMWTHTLNLSEDDPHEALREMVATAQAQPMLRRMAGQAAAGRPTKDSVYHVALSWEPSERPDKAHMIEAAQSFLRHMGHANFQCLMVAHAPDVSGRLHLHLEVNRIHPLTGATMSNPKNDFRRAQAWAKQYQDERGQTFCPERTKRAEGKPYQNLHMPRWQYEQWKQSGLTREAYLFGVEKFRAQAENWQALKPAQMAERKQYFADTRAGMKGLRAEVWVAVKAEFAPRWQAYARQREQAALERTTFSQQLAGRLRLEGYRDWATLLRRAERQHAAELRERLRVTRAGIQAAQSARFEQISEAAFQRYKDGRDAGYTALLTRQKAERHQLHAGQPVAAQPSPPATAAQLAEARARAILAAMQAAPVAPSVKPALNVAPPLPPAPQAEAARSPGTGQPTPRSPVEQGKKPMLDEDQKRKKATAKTEPFIFTPPPPPPPRTTRTTPEEAAAHARENRAYEQEKRAAEASHAQQFGAGPNYVDPNATAKSEHGKWVAERRAELRAREAASQPHKGPSQEAKPLQSNEHRPENWRGGTPQYGFGFTPGSPPDPLGHSQPSSRQHPAPQMERAPLNAPLQGDEWRKNHDIRATEEAKRQTKAIDQARYEARTGFLDNKRATAPDPSRTADPGNKLRSQQHAAAHEVATTDREVDPRRAALRARYSAGKEVTDRMAAQQAGPVEKSDRNGVVSDREARRQAIRGHSAERSAQEREHGRDR